MLLLLAAVAGMLLGAGCQRADYQFRTYKIGLAAPLSGQAFSEGNRWLGAARLAIGQWNEAAGARRYRMELVALDEAEGPSGARRLALDPDVLGVVGHWDGASVGPALEEYRRAGLTLLLAGASDLLPNAQGSGALRLSPSAATLSRGVGSFIAQGLGRGSAAVVAGPALRDLSVGEALRAGAAEAGLRVLRAEAVPPYSADYRDILERLPSAAPQAILYSGGPAEAGSFLEQLRQHEGWRPPPVVLAPHAGSPEALPTAAAASAVVYWAAGAGDARATNAGKAFWASYQARWGQAPSPYAAVVYDGTNLLLQGIEAAVAGRDGDARGGGARLSGT